MTKTDVFSNRIVTRRAFLYSSAAMLAVPLLKPSFALVPSKSLSSTDYSSAIEKIKQTLPIAMAERDITGASIALVDGDNIVWSEGFGYTNRSRKVKVTGDTLFHAGSISKSFTALATLRAVDANDLARFIIFHLQSGAANGKQILPATLLKEMYAPQFTAKDQISGYGLGVYKALQNDTVRFSHGGLGYGISTHYRFLPEHKIGVVLLTNQDTAHNAPQLAGRVIEWMLTAKLGAAPKSNPVSAREKPVVSLSEETLRRFEGTYLLYEGILFRFRYEKGSLFHIVGNEKLKLVGLSQTEFVSSSRLYRFLLTENGRPKGVQIIDDYYDPQTAELYLNDTLKLRESSSNSFICADGEAVIFKGEELLVGNRLYFRKE